MLELTTENEKQRGGRAGLDGGPHDRQVDKFTVFGRYAPGPGTTFPVQCRSRHMDDFTIHQTFK